MPLFLWSEELFCKMNNYPLLNLFCIFHFAVSGFVEAAGTAVLLIIVCSE